MITHIVLFKLQEFPSGEKEAICLELKLKLEALATEIPEVVSMQAGINMLHPEKNYDLMLVSRFRNADDLETYRVHPAHQRVVARIHQVVASRAPIDVELEIPIQS